MEWYCTVPVSDWNEEGSLQYLRPGCGDAGSDGNGNTILCDEDPVGNICANGFDDDQDGLVDSADPDGDGDADCSSNDDDGDGLILSMKMSMVGIPMVMECLMVGKLIMI